MRKLWISRRVKLKFKGNFRKELGKCWGDVKEISLVFEKKKNLKINF